MWAPRVVCNASRLPVVARSSATSLRLTPVASFRSGRPDLFSSSVVSKNTAATPASETTTQSGEPKSKLHGSYHWDFERALSLVSVPLIAAPFVIGSNPYVDLALGVVIPLHTHIGFDAIIQDYLPKRRNPVAFRVLSYTLYAATGLTLYGCYQFNTNDIGITEFVKRLWVGKQ
ncbi:CybS-domain-containing protein [Phlyctochytrium arcticum]|nr:CybS-domain-containing protein [Phlyctochytrium arcticum]